MAYDIIGDIHGQHTKLVKLLSHLGYSESDNVWKHPTHKAIFVGDLIDSANSDENISHVKTVNIVKNMVENDSAFCILGNHEFNAIAWFTPDPENEHAFLRLHNESNRRQHQVFLNEVEGKSIHADIIEWFKSLPVWLELPEGIRVIHAAWVEDYQKILRPYLNENNTLTEELIIRASRKGSPEYEAIEGLCKGLETKLPDNASFSDKHGNIRQHVRIPWWHKEKYGSYKEEALVPHSAKQYIPDIKMNRDLRVKPYNDLPVFIGHYWFTGIPNILTDKIACVDYSAGENGALVAYRWQGEQILKNSGFKTSFV